MAEWKCIQRGLLSNVSKFSPENKSNVLREKNCCVPVQPIKCSFSCISNFLKGLLIKKCKKTCATIIHVMDLKRRRKREGKGHY